MDLAAKLQGIENESNARSVLAKEWPALPAALISVAWTSLFIFGVLEMNLPMVSTLCLAIGIGPVPYMCIENWYMRRRLEAAIALLQATRDGR